MILIPIKKESKSKLQKIFQKLKNNAVFGNCGKFNENGRKCNETLCHQACSCK